MTPLETFPIPLSITQQALMALRKHATWWPDSTKERVLNSFLRKMMICHTFRLVNILCSIWTCSLGRFLLNVVFMRKKVSEYFSSRSRRFPNSACTSSLSLTCHRRKNGSSSRTSGRFSTSWSESTRPARFWATIRKMSDSSF